MNHTDPYSVLFFYKISVDTMITVQIFVKYADIQIQFVKSSLVKIKIKIKIGVQLLLLWHLKYR